MIESLAGQGHSAKKLCQMLGVAPSGFFYWRSRPPTMLELRTEHLGGLIADIHHASRGTYGTRRVTAELRLGYDVTANRKAVRRIMRSLGLQGLPLLKAKRRGPLTDGAAAGDLVLRQFSRDAPDRLWLTDITEHPTREGKLYCCVVLDAFSRSIVGWSIDTQQAASLVMSALGMAITKRKPKDGAVVHSDHGTQFTSWAFSDRVKGAGLALSDGPRRRRLRQRDDGGVLGAHADRAAQPPPLAYPPGAHQRDLRVRRGLPQPPTPPQRSRNAHTRRI